MPINISSAPSGALAALETGLAKHGAPEARHLAELTTGHQTDWEAGLPHAVYNLGLDAVTSGRGLDAADNVGWRFLFGQPSQPAALAAETHGTESTGHTFAALNLGPFNAQMVETMKGLESNPTVLAGDFEPRFLRIPALQVNAVWLKDRRSGHDLIIPMHPSNPAVTPGRVYQRDEFMAALAAAARSLQSAMPPQGDLGPHAP